jgi:hypothetical protein
VSGTRRHEEAMPRHRPAIAAVAAFVALVSLLVPAGLAAAAELVDVSGTVRTTDGAAAAGIEVLVSVAGSDIVVPATTDENGAYAVQVEAAAGDTLEVRATGATVRTGPDAEGCTQSRTPTGRTSVILETLPPGPVDVLLDDLIESETCAATGKPTPGPTPPSTDVVAAVRPAGADAGAMTWLLVGFSWLAAAGAIAAVRRRA